MNLQRLPMVAVLANIAISAFFVYVSMFAWDFLDGHISHWDMFWINAHSPSIPGIPPSGFNISMPNYLFWLFFLSTALNLYFIFRLQRSKETKP